jgi:hypothetical protein
VSNPPLLAPLACLLALLMREMVMKVEWARPNPDRLNDTEAIVRKGTYPYALRLRGGVGFAPIETPYLAENTFGKNSGRFRSNGSAPDARETPTLRVACKTIPSSC